MANKNERGTRKTHTHGHPGHEIIPRSYCGGPKKSTNHGCLNLAGYVIFGAYVGYDLLTTLAPPEMIKVPRFL